MVAFFATEIDLVLFARIFPRLTNSSDVVDCQIRTSDHTFGKSSLNLLIKLLQHEVFHGKKF